tara:strand:- start:986 stop:1273 length:288 start_codon:yes stop_codon:yes gene_type:complete
MAEPETDNRVELIRTKLNSGPEGDQMKERLLTQEEMRTLLSEENFKKIWSEVQRQIPKLHLDIKTPISWQWLSAALIFQVITNVILIAVLLKFLL